MIEIIDLNSAHYPALLKLIKKPPKKLYCIGNTELLQKRCVSIVGSRRAPQYGRSTALNIADKLASKKIVVVSGMATGIDTCAHRGALDAGGETIAVLGCGPDICYPRENKKLKEEIEVGGLVISEFPPGTEPQKYHFPMRNRIISGLSEATVIVQAANNSGALITAELAAEQGREVCVVPGNIDSQYNLGSNKLIKDGARPLITTNDILEVMGLDLMDEIRANEILSDNEKKIFMLLNEYGEMTVDEICIRLEKPPAYISSIITVMEIKGAVFTSLGKIFIAKG